MKDVYIIGAQCTGKTTLVNALVRHYARSDESRPPSTSQPTIISEIARTVIKQLGLDRNDIEFSPQRCLQIQKAILQAQFEAETKQTQTESGWHISDRSGIDPIVYARLFAGEAAAVQLLSSPEWEFLERNMKAGQVFLCEAGCTWLVDDGTRLMPKDTEDWTRFDHAFRQLLFERQIEYTIIPSDMSSITHRVDLILNTHAQ